MNIVDLLSQYVTSNILVASIAALLAGIISSFSPCTLSSIPVLIGYIGGIKKSSKAAAFKYTLLFCLGLVLVLTSVGALSAILGKFLSFTGKWWYLILGILMAVMSFEIMGVIHLFPQKCDVAPKKTDKAGAFLLGITAGLFASPCATPVLVVILGIVAESQDVLKGIILLLFYSLGYTTLIFISGMSVSFINKIIKSDATGKISKYVRIIFGIIIMLFSIYLFYNAF